MHTPKGDSVTAYNGQAGWIAFPGRPLREMSAPDQAGCQTRCRSVLSRQARAQFTELKLQEHPEKIGDQEADVVLGLEQGPAAGEALLRQDFGLAGAHGALRRHAAGAESDAGGFCRLSRSGRREDAVSLDDRAAQRRLHYTDRSRWNRTFRSTARSLSNHGAAPPLPGTGMHPMPEGPQPSGLVPPGSTLAE